MNAVWTWGLLLLMASSARGQCFGESDDALGTRATSANGGSLSAGSTKFALNLFKSVVPSNGGPEDNVVISPFSVWSALLLTYMGARHHTKTEMENGLGLNSNNQQRVSALYDALQDQLLHNATRHSNYTFHTANKIYVNQSFELRRCIVDRFGGDIEKMNFKTAPEPSRRIINRWVEQQTNDKIRDLIPEGYIDPRTTVMVLVNAAYFKGYWASQFSERSTIKTDFFVSPTITTRVDTMVQEGHFPLLKNSPLGVSAVELPYSGNDVSMVIVLPDRGTKAENLVPRLTAETFRSIYDSLGMTKVMLHLPKFKDVLSMELKDHIESLGIKDLFDEKRADLSGLTGFKEPYVQYVRHKTFVEVNEGGTEAAAATAVLFGVPLSLGPPPPPPEIFIVDRPFLFVIRHKPTSTILFMGLIRSPKT